MPRIARADLTDLYTNNPELTTEFRRVSDALCAAPGISNAEAALRLGLPVSRVAKVGAHLGLTRFRDRVLRGGGLTGLVKTARISRQVVYPRRMGQIVEVDTTCLGVMVRDGVACKLLATVACDSLTRTIVTLPGSDAEAFSNAVNRIQAITGPSDLILCDRREGVADALRVSTGVPVRTIAKLECDGIFSTHRVERSHSWIKRKMAKTDCRQLPTVESVYDLLAATAADYDVGFGDLPPSRMRDDLRSKGKLALDAADVLQLAGARGYRQPAVRAIDFYGQETTADPFAFVLNEPPAPARAGRLKSFGAIRQPGFYWSSTDASEET